MLFCLLCVFSLRAFRQAAYEVRQGTFSQSPNTQSINNPPPHAHAPHPQVFITFHILFAVFALVGVYYHIYLLRSSKMAEFLHFIWAACVFWAFDRVARLARLLFINVHLPFLGGAGTAGTTPLCSRGTVTALPDDSMRVRIHPAGRALAMFGKMRPGSNVFLRVPRIQPWASHPFTVIEQRWEATESESYVDLIVNPVDGFTKRLAKRVASQPREMVMLLEGPYGSPPDVSCPDSNLGLVSHSHAEYVVTPCAARDDRHLAPRSRRRGHNLLPPSLDGHHATVVSRLSSSNRIRRQ